MDTVILKIDDSDIDERKIKYAADVLAKGGLVAFPTETVYGLGGNAFDPHASDRIYRAKGRPSDNPLIVHISDKTQVYDLAKEVGSVAEKLMDRFWPGPMTLIFKKKNTVPDETTGGLKTVAVRCPSHPVARKLIKLSGVCVAAPSANLSGRPSPTDAKHVIDDLQGRIDMIIDSGPVGLGLESTIIDVTEDTPVMLRPGFVTEKMLLDTVKNLEIDKGVRERIPDGEAPKAPGMKYRHYAPKGDMILYRGEPEKVALKIIEEAEKYANKGKSCAVVTYSENEHLYRNKLPDEVDIKIPGSLECKETVAGKLFSVLRDLDDEERDIILCEAVDENGLGLAIMNRLTKAAGYNIVDV